MPVSNATSIITSPLLAPPVKGGNRFREQVNVSGRGTGKVSMKFQSCRGSKNQQIKLSTSGPVGLGCKLQPNRRRMQSATFITSASASGQTQTIEAPTTKITNAPASPKLDDGGSGFPPRDDGGGGGGGGGGGDFSGGFYLFGFLAFLGLLKDLEGEQNYRGSRRRR